MKIKALLVEDDPKLRFLFRRLLEKNLDLQVVEASNGVEALTVLHKEKPVIVFLDIHLPIMDGVEFLDVVRNDRTTKNIIVVMMTSSNDPETVDQILKLGVSDYILKSDRFDELNARLSGILAKYNSLLSERMRKNYSSGEGHGNNRIVFYNKPLALIEKLKSSLEAYCEIYTGNSGAECLSLYLENKPAFVFLVENTPILNERKVLEKIKSLDIEKLTEIILLYTDENYHDKELFSSAVKLTNNIDSDFTAIKQLINEKIPEPLR